MTLVLVPVEEVQAGDLLQLPSHVERRVDHVSLYDDDTVYVIVYVANVEESYENKASAARGVSRTSGGCYLKSWKPLRKGELVPVLR